MAFEEDLNKRREQREKLRQQRLVENRKLITKLVIAGIALVLCTVLIIVVAVQSGSSDPTKPVGTTTEPSQMEPSTGATEDTTSSTGETQPDETENTGDTTGGTGEPGSTEETQSVQSTAPSESEYTVIHFAATGDVNISDITGAMDFEYAFRDLLPVLSGADLTVVNFEGNLVGEPYGAEKASAPQTLMTALKNAGVDLVQMANSYSIYNGLSGLRTTLSAIEAAGMEPVGAWATAEEAQQAGGYTIREVNGVKVAIVAFTKGMNSMALPSGSEDCVNVLYTDYATTYQSVDTAGITAILENVAAEEPDITIALVHWGSEYRDQISTTQGRIRDLMLSLGVDAIIGTHPHYVQSLNFNAENGTFVAYSLGDLLSDAQTPGTEYGLILDLEITKDNVTGETRVTNYSYTSVFNVHEEGKTSRVVRLDEAVAAYEAGYLYRVSKDTYDDMLYAQNRVLARVAPEDTEE